MENICRKCTPETNSRPLFKFVKKLEIQACFQENILEIRYYSNKKK